MPILERSPRRTSDQMAQLLRRQEQMLRGSKSRETEIRDWPEEVCEKTVDSKGPEINKNK
jgi:hypothetical protein